MNILFENWTVVQYLSLIKKKKRKEKSFSPVRPLGLSFTRLFTVEFLFIFLIRGIHPVATEVNELTDATLTEEEGRSVIE